MTREEKRTEIAVDKIDEEVELTKWIDEVDAEVTVDEIFKRIMQPKRHELWVEAYWLVGKIRGVGLAWQSVKRIYGQHRRNRDEGRPRTRTDLSPRRS